MKAIEVSISIYKDADKKDHESSREVLVMGENYTEIGKKMDSLELKDNEKISYLDLKDEVIVI